MIRQVVSLSFLSKFSAVEIKSDTRISESDKKFCKAHQAAYENAISLLYELKFFWESMLESQKQILAPVGEQRYQQYLVDGSNLSLSLPEIQKQIRQTHEVLIEKIVDHFSGVYSIALSRSDVKEALLPEKPKDRWGSRYDEQLEKYEQALEVLQLHYDKIIEQIFIQTDGRGLWEQAEHQLKERCRDGATSWGSPDYTIKKHTIQFSRAVHGDRSLYNSTKDILRGLSHFETGQLGVIPRDFTCLFDYRLPWETFECDDCKKVKKIRAFLNGRLDIRFAEEAYAVQFAREYLGMIGGSV